MYTLPIINVRKVKVLLLKVLDDLDIGETDINKSSEERCAFLASNPMES